jgi:hypothetical protein
LQNLISYFFLDYRLKIQTIWFKRALYLFLLIKSIYWICYYDVLFGKNSVVSPAPQSIGVVRDLAFFLYNSSSPTISAYFIFILVMCLFLSAIYSKLYFCVDLIIWFVVVNLQQKIYATQTAGDFILNQLLFFNCFLAASCTSATAVKGSLKTFLHNLGCIAIIVQICLLYFLSGLAKLNDPSWLSGSAIAQISQINHFSIRSLLNLGLNLKGVFLVLNYLVLFYQIGFPFLIWIGKIKKALLITGILMHLYIAFVMGLVDFGLIMIFPYIYFWPVKRQVS